MVDWCESCRASVRIPKPKMDVIEVIDGAFKDFQQMWADIGYTEEDQIKEVNEFVGSITKLCTDKVERLKEEKEQMMLDVTHSIDQIKKLAKQLDDGEVEIVLPFFLRISLGLFASSPFWCSRLPNSPSSPCARCSPNCKVIFDLCERYDTL